MEYGDKTQLSNLVKKEFNLINDRSVFYCNEFAIRFSKCEKRKMGNTVLSLKTLKKYDDRPVILCIVASQINYLLIINSTFIKKLSETSHQLRENNIVGSFNGPDIIYNYKGIENEPNNFEKLYNIHALNSFEENLRRIVNETDNIVGYKKRFEVTNENRKTIFSSIERTEKFINSKEYNELEIDLANRVKEVKNEIIIAANRYNNNVNMRGRVIEALITDNGIIGRKELIKKLKNDEPISNFGTEDKLGDYSKSFELYNVEIDIKSKLMFGILGSCPKGYNIDKLLNFLSNEKSVYMLYLVGIKKNGEIITRLCSAFDKRIINKTSIKKQWSGRNSSGGTQFIGNALEDVLKDENKNVIDVEKAKEFIRKLINEN